MAHEIPDLHLTHVPWHGVIDLRDEIALAYRLAERMWEEAIFAILPKKENP